MTLPNIFTNQVSEEVIRRINTLNKDSEALWGIMNVAQMLAHCNVTYEMAFENIHPKPNLFLRFVLRFFVKKYVVTEMPYAKSTKTAPAFIITTEKDFDSEKTRLINYINKAQQLGEYYFEGKESVSFGGLNKTEWNNMFYKHLDHHLKQFGA